MSAYNLLRVVFSSLAIVVACNDVFAWDTEASVSVSESYTDNRCLSETDEQDEWVTTLTPRVGVSGESARASLNLQAEMGVSNRDSSDDCPSGSNFGRAGNRDRTNPQLNANGSVELIRQTFFVDANARVRNNAIDAYSSFSDDTVNSRGNRNTTYSYSVSPYLVGQVAGFAGYTIRAGIDRQSNSANAVGDSDEESASVSVYGLDSGRLSWSLGYNFRREEYDENRLLPGEENELASASAFLGYLVSPTLQFNVTAGEDFNEFSTLQSDIEGSFWELGASWSPNARTAIELGYGDRFFGSSKRLTITHKKRRSRFALSYDEEVTSSRQLRNEDVFIPLIDDEGNLLTIDGQPLFIATTLATLTRNPILEERLQASYRLEGRRSSIGFSISVSDQTRFEDNLNSTFSNYAINFSRELARNLSFNASVNYEEREADEGFRLGQDSETWRYRLGVNRGLSDNTTLSLNYTFTDRSGDGNAEEYQENLFVISLRMSFN